MLKFSLVVPYRNRDVEVAKRCISSLINQSIFQNNNIPVEAEIFFIDYGSDIEKSSELEKFCQETDLITYIYTETRGKFWCKPEALNLALNKATGDYFITIDVDMIHLPNFLEEISHYVEQNTLLHYQCYYLPSNFDYTNYLNTLQNTDVTSLDESSKTSALGIFAVKTSELKHIGGFDEYFRMWGIEDKDIHYRLSRNLDVKWFPLEKSPVFHQWHPVSNNPLAQPKGWEKTVIDHYHNKYDKPELLIHKKTNGEKSGKLYKREERPALHIFENGNLKSNFNFEFPIEKAYSSFISQFMKLEKNEPLILNQSFSLIDENATSKAAKGVRKINTLLEKVKVSYRMTELLKHTYGNIDFYQVRDFLFYFIVDFEDFIEDYYYEQENGTNGNPEKITLILFKK
ncbi:glycosyltransferase [Bernardetia sp.]|uniref:glycosyltransferase n=1 Tax=Bernardetia sp. TaxID=1937974 RepID=UPI0025BCC771|nr:glycosyltransferase [Bernardetia sp.]